MGKKSKRSKNKNNGGGPLRKILPTGTICDTICRLAYANQYDEILKVESKLRHLDSFSDDPERDAHVLYWFGSAHYYHCIVKDGSCFDQVIDRAIDYFERAKERVEDSKPAVIDASLHNHSRQELRCNWLYCIQMAVTWKNQSLRIEGSLKIVIVTKSLRCMSFKSATISNDLKSLCTRLKC